MQKAIQCALNKPDILKFMQTFEKYMFEGVKMKTRNGIKMTNERLVSFIILFLFSLFLFSRTTFSMIAESS